MQEIKESEVKYAGFWIRFLAMIIDSAILAIIRVAAIISTQDALFSSFVLFAFHLLYFPMFHSSTWQATIGKKIMGLKLVGADYQSVSFLRCFGRELAKILSGLILLIGYMMAGWNSKKRALHDMIAKTYVIKSRG